MLRFGDSDGLGLGWVPVCAIAWNSMQQRPLRRSRAHNSQSPKATSPPLSAPSPLMHSLRLQILASCSSRALRANYFPGSRHASSIAGALFVSGSSSTGQLGIEAASKTKAGPELVPLPEPVSHVALGAFHALAVGSSGSLYGWGGGEHGQNGHGFKTQVDRPKLIKGVGDVRFTSVAAGKMHSLALSR